MRSSCRHSGALKPALAQVVHLDSSTPQMALKLQRGARSSPDRNLGVACTMLPGKGVPTRLRAFAALYPADGELVDAERAPGAFAAS